MRYEMPMNPIIVVEAFDVWGLISWVLLYLEMENGLSWLPLIILLDGLRRRLAPMPMARLL